jgi:hypothetical protein
MRARQHFWLFSLFFREFTASRSSFSAEILGFRGTEGRNNSQTGRCFSLFPAVFLRM